MEDPCVYNHSILLNIRNSRTESDGTNYAGSDYKIRYLRDYTW